MLIVCNPHCLITDTWTNDVFLPTANIHGASNADKGDLHFVIKSCDSSRIICLSKEGNN